MVMLKQVAEKCSWGPHCPICKNEEKYEKDWDGDRQKEQPRMCPQNAQCPQAQNTHCPQTQSTQQPQSQNIQCPQPQNTQHSQSFDVPDRYPKQIQLRREWEEKIE